MSAWPRAKATRQGRPLLPPAARGRAEQWRRRRRSRLRFRGLLAECGFARVRDRDPFRVRHGIGNVAVVPVPPFVGPLLWVAFRRILPLLLAAEGGHVEI